MERKIIICAVVAMSLLMLLNSIVGLSSAQEKSTEKTIIWIHNVYELQNMSKNLSGNYALANDIDATITKTWNNGSGFVPIGNYNNRFGGTFDGKGYKIINLYINRSSQNDVGLFGYTSKYAVIENVGLVNVSVSGNYDVGGLVGWNYYGTVSNSYATGNVSGNYAVGGFVGENYYGMVSNSYSTGSVSGYGDVGGLVGLNYHGTVNNSHYDVDRVLINGGHYVTRGGIFDSQYNDWISHNLSLNISNYPSLVPDGEYYDISDVQGIKDMLGFCEDGLKFKLVADIDLSYEPNLYIPYFDGVFDGNNHTISNLNVQISFASEIGLFGFNRGTVRNIATLNVNVSGPCWVGGLIGENYGTVNNSYATGNVSGDWFVGGLIGYNHGTVNNSYATGNVSGDWDIGGLVGYNVYGTVSNSYSTGNVSGDWCVGGFVGLNVGTVKNSHYDVDKVLINGGHYLTIGGLFDSQYNDWISHNLSLNISNYPSLVPDGEYYDISDVQGIKDLLGFCEDGLKFKLVADIDLSSEPNLYIPYFDGVFNGNNHTISNLNVQISFASEIGLFGFNRGTIRNIGALNVNVGGVGGNYDVGGLVGWNYYGTVSNSYATGNVSGRRYVGGLIGENYGTVNNSYATGNVSGSDWDVGGLIGLNFGTVSNSYSTGNVSGRRYVGGLVGYNYGTVAASFWDVNTSGINHSDGGTGKTTEEMKNKTTFLNADWDFTNIWDIVDGQTYPFFKWQTPSKPSSPRYLHATAGDGYVNLTWTNPSFDGASPITEYRIYRNGVLIKTVSATQLWFNDTTVENGQTYTYYVTAVNAAGESPKSNEVQATPGGNIPEMSIWLIGIIAIVLLFAKRRR